MPVNTQDPDLDFSSLTTPDQLEVRAVDLKSAALVVPSDAPVPNELQAHVSSGGLYERLRPLTEEGSATSVVPVSGPELLALAQAWRSLVTVKKVYVLTGLPGARYDVIFNSALRQIGLRSVDWTDVAEVLARAQAADQSRNDSQPWLGDPTAAAPAPRRGPRLARTAAVAQSARIELNPSDSASDDVEDV